MVEAITKAAAGLDVHKMMVMASVIVEREDGSLFQRTKEFNTFKRGRHAMCQWLQEHGIEYIVLESTGIYWKSIYAALEDAGLHTHVVNARHVKQVPGRKTDVLDSQWLASLARFGLLRSSFIPPRDLRELRLISRHRQKAQSILAAEKNRLHKVLDDAGVRLGGVVSDINGVSASRIIEGLVAGEASEELMQHVRGRLKSKIPQLKESVDETLSERHLYLLKVLQEHIRYLQNSIEEMDQRLYQSMTPYQQAWELLQTLPGVDRWAATSILIEIGVDMSQFRNIQQFTSWAGLCPGNNESAGKRKSGKTRKGNRSLRRTLCEVANAASRTKSQFKGKYQGLVIRRGHKRTIIALAHKILRIIYSMFKNMQPYRDPEIDYEAIMVAKNASRWMKKLREFGYLPQLQAI